MPAGRGLYQLLKLMDMHGIYSKSKVSNMEYFQILFGLCSSWTVRSGPNGETYIMIFKAGSQKTGVLQRDLPWEFIAEPYAAETMNE